VEVSAAEPRPLKVRFLHMCMLKVSMYKSRAGKVRTNEMCVGKKTAIESGLHQPSAREVRTEHSCKAKVGVTKVRTSKICFSKVGLEEIYAAKDCLAQIDGREVRS
jgi:hypothetical protein